VAAQVLRSLGEGLNIVRPKVMELVEEGMISDALAPPEREVRLPRCPRCSEELAAAARITRLDVEDAEGEAPRRSVVFVFCRRCGTTLGSWPADE
jgi:hypothetical protein